MSHSGQRKKGEGIRLRRILDCVEPQIVLEGAGVRLKRTIASRALDYVDPFLLFDHFGSDDPEDYIAGFPMHPHRGIETVTYMLAGTVHHRDSIGNVGRIEPGDVQWMTAGRGILHEEMPRPRDGRMEGFQLWVNLPSNLKMTQPRYQAIDSALIPVVDQEDGARIRVIAGTVDGVQGPVAASPADPCFLDISMDPFSTFVRPVERGRAAVAYIFEGEGVAGATEDEPWQVTRPLTLAVFGDGDYVRAQTAEHPLRFLLISGKPSHEPIVRYGPFVMNTPDEIEQALQDLREGTFAQ